MAEYDWFDLDRGWQWRDSSLTNIKEPRMENATLVANALTRDCHQVGAALSPMGLAYQETPENIIKAKADYERRETFYRKQRRAAAIVGIAEALVTGHAVNPNQALTTAEDFFTICEAFMTKETETTEA